MASDVKSAEAENKMLSVGICTWCCKWVLKLPVGCMICLDGSWSFQG